MEHRFGTSRRFSLGIEEEFQLVGRESYELVSRIDEILSEVEDEEEHEGRVKPELLQSAVEVATNVAHSVEEAMEDLRSLRARLRDAAAERDALIASAGTHPFSRYEHQEVTDRPRYRELIEDMGWVAERELIFGLHVHVGLGSPDTAIACLNATRTFLPELLALSANSPFWQARADRACLDPHEDLRGLPACGPAADLRLVEGVRAARRARDQGGLLSRLHVHLVGRAPAPAARDDRAADLRRPGFDRGGRGHRRARAEPRGHAGRGLRSR